MNAGRKDDAGKRRWHLLPWREVGTVVDVLGVGAERYGDANWQRVENPRERYFDAAQRHLTAWHAGHEADPDTGLPHLAHAVCCLLFLMWFDRESGA